MKLYLFYTRFEHLPFGGVDDFDNCKISRDYHLTPDPPVWVEGGFVDLGQLDWKQGDLYDRDSGGWDLTAKELFDEIGVELEPHEYFVIELCPT